ncbi:MAG: hypothetical protein FWD29_01560 [Micrococcales bacterium]|nr:hypothetical protein [Micrococcales bacterium]
MGIDEVVILLLGIATGIATLVLISLGLAVIFGMMKVINFAHGEFLMLGAFFTLTGVRLGIPLWISMILASLGTGLLGVVVERALIRRFYGRTEVTILATFGLSLVLTQVALLIWGTSPEGIATPLGKMTIGSYSIANYRLVLIVGAAGLLVLAWMVFTRTRVGLMARAATERPEMASSLGINISNVNMFTFGFGSALAGAGGALLSPVVAIAATMGTVYIARAFMTVVVGGPGVITGVSLSASGLGAIERLVAQWSGPMAGIAALLFAAIIALRFLPTGISGKLGKRL